MHLVILSQYYPPEIGAPQARLSEFARGLQERGHKITVLTAMPNYPKGKVYPGYGGIRKIELEDGIRIIHVPIFATQKASFLPRLTSYFSFVLTALLIGGWFFPPADLLITESPPLFLGIAGYLLSRWKKARWIFNVSDLWPESAVRLGIVKGGLALRLSLMLEAFCYRKAWMVSGQSKGILKNITERFPGIRTFHFSNGVNTEIFHPKASTLESRDILGKNGGVVALYAGLHGLAQGLDQILSAALMLQDQQNIVFVFIGDGPEKKSLQEIAHNLNLKNIRFIDSVPQKQMPSIVASADICLIPLKKHIPGAIPSKLYEAMACARPVILIAEGEAAEIVSSNQAGIVIKPGDVNGLSGALQQMVGDPAMRERMGESGRQAVELHFNRRKIVDDFITFLEANTCR